MHKTAAISTRIDQILKKHAEDILYEFGLTPAEAIRLFYNQICLQNGLPFDIKIPNKVTRKAMRDADMRKTHKTKINIS